MDHNASGRRPHYHRGRRGMDRRGTDRRSEQAAEQTPRPSGDQVDVEQIMREIRSRIAQRGVDLSPQQIQDLAARRLEAILDPRTMNPSLFDQLRKGAAVPPEAAPRTADADAEFTEESLYEGSAMVRFIRRLFNPLLKLLFNPAPLAAAFQTQARLSREAAERAIERERRQTEWNALHYQILQRLVTEVSRTSLETQALSGRLEALAGRVDYNDRRVRTLESAPAPTARSPRPQEPSLPAAPAPSHAAAAVDAEGGTPGTPGPSSDAPRRRRRRRRGRRGATLSAESAGPDAVPPVDNPDDGIDGDERDDEENGGATSLESRPAESVAGAPESPEPSAPAHTAALLPEHTATSSEAAAVVPTPSQDPGPPEQR